MSRQTYHNNECQNVHAKPTTITSNTELLPELNDGCHGCGFWETSHTEGWVDLQGKLPVIR